MTKYSSFALALVWLVVVTSLTTTEANEATATGIITNRGIFFDPIALSFEQEVGAEQFGEPTPPTSSIRTNNSGKKNTLRHLDEDDELLTKYSFPECIDESLTPEECKSSIEEQIETAGGHQVGDIQIKIQVPRTPEQFAESYWMVEVPVDLHGNVACDRNDGVIVYPFVWMVDGVTGVTVDNVDCHGLRAGRCCVNLRQQSKGLTSSGGYDQNGQCLSCFVYQEPLEPVWNATSGETEYLECFDVVGAIEGACRPEQLTGTEVDNMDKQTAARIQSAINTLENFNEKRSCDDFEQLLVKLYNAAVVIAPLSIKIGRLACSICYGEQDLPLEDDDVTSLLMDILNLLQKYSPPPSSKENCIIIYTDEQGDIALEPTLGGSRSDNSAKNSYCNDDDDCVLGEQWCDTLINTCRTYRDIGDQCGDDYFYFDDFYGKCNPSEAVCVNAFNCTESGDLRALDSKACAAYGKEGPCTTSADCNDNEYCNKADSRCLVNRNEGECCDPKINNCGFDETGNSLVCGPDTSPESYYDPIYTCRRQCDTDDDCMEDDEKCVPDIDDEFPLVENYCTAYNANL